MDFQDIQKEYLSKNGGGGSIKPSIPSKFYVFVMGGQSNNNGYGELPYNINDPMNTDPRIFQLARYTKSTTLTVDTITQVASGYGDKFDQLRGEDDDANLKIIPAVPCLDNIQNMFQAVAGNNSGGTVGFGLYLAKLILKYIPEDYGILIIPHARGGSAFTKGAIGTYDAERMYASASSQRWGIDTPLGLGLKDRILYALGLNPENKLLPIVWSQGEFDAGNTSGHYAGFKAYVDFLKEQLTSVQDQICGGTINHFRILCTSSTKWMYGMNTVDNFSTDYLYNDDACSRASIYQNYVSLMNDKDYQNYTGKQIIYVNCMFKENGMFTTTNREEGTGATTSTREIHWSTSANMFELPPIIFNAMSKYANFFGAKSGGLSIQNAINSQCQYMSDGTKNSFTLNGDMFNLGRGLIVYQDFATGATNENKATGGIALTAGSGVTIVDDPTFGKVAQFDGTSNARIIYNCGLGRSSYTKTVTFRLNPATTLSGNKNLLSATSDNNDGIIWFVDGTLNIVASYNERSKGILISPSANANWLGEVGDWQTITASYDLDTNKKYIYLNGVLVGEIDSTIATLNSVNLGAYKTVLTWDAWVAHTSIHNRCLGADEVQGLFLKSWRPTIQPATRVFKDTKKEALRLSKSGDLNKVLDYENDIPKANKVDLNDYK